MNSNCGWTRTSLPWSEVEMRMKKIFPHLLFIVFFSLEATAQSGRYLFPITRTNVNGTHGSLWVTELYAHNHSDEPIWISNNFNCQFSAVHACDAELRPRSSMGLSSDPYDIYGVVEERDIGKVSSSSFVRNVSGRVQSWGTAIPVPDLTAFRS